MYLAHELERRTRAWFGSSEVNPISRSCVSEKPGQLQYGPKFHRRFLSGPKAAVLEAPPSSVKLGLRDVQVEVVRGPAIEPCHEMFWIFAVDIFSGLDDVDHPLVSRRSAAILRRPGSVSVQEPLFEGLCFGVNRDELDLVHPVVAVIIEVLAPLRDCFSGEVAVQLDLPRVRRCRAAVVFVGHEAGDILTLKAG